MIESWSRFIPGLDKNTVRVFFFLDKNVLFNPASLLFMIPYYLNGKHGRGSNK